MNEHVTPRVMSAVLSPHVCTQPLDVPTLRAEGLLLRRFRPADAVAVSHAYADPAMRSFHRKDLRHPDAAATWVETEARGQARSVSWAVIDQVTEVLVGQVALRRVNVASELAMCSYWVLPEARGRNVTKRALVPMLAWAFNGLHLHRIELMHSTRNPASCAVARSAGFRYEGTRRSHLRHEDGWHDMHLHARLDNDPFDP